MYTLSIFAITVFYWRHNPAGLAAFVHSALERSQCSAHLLCFLVVWWRWRCTPGPGCVLWGEIGCVLYTITHQLQLGQLGAVGLHRNHQLKSNTEFAAASLPWLWLSIREFNGYSPFSFFIDHRLLECNTLQSCLSLYYCDRVALGSQHSSLLYLCLPLQLDLDSPL